MSARHSRNRFHPLIQPVMLPSRMYDLKICLDATLWWTCKGMCGSLSCTAPNKDNCPSCFHAEVGVCTRAGDKDSVLFIWAAASVLILNTGGERDSQQEGGRNHCWHVQAGRLMVSLSFSPMCRPGGRDTGAAVLGTVKHTAQCLPAATLINETEMTQKNSQCFGRRIHRLFFL